MNFRTSFNGPLAWSLIAIAVVAVALVMMVPAVLSAAFAPSADEGVIDETFARLMDENDEALETFEARFVGRSAFYTPRVVRPSPPRREAPVRTVERTPQPEPRDIKPPMPRRYEGPDIHAFIGDVVWFVDGNRVRAGDEGSNGVKVISVEAPWKATLLYRGWEGHVDLFDSSVPWLTTGAKPNRANVPGLVDESKPDKTDGADDATSPAPDAAKTAEAKTGAAKAPAETERDRNRREEGPGSDDVDGDGIEDDGLTDAERAKRRAEADRAEKSRVLREKNANEQPAKTRTDKPAPGSDPAPPE